jgi:predicted N-acetyltransferase YhbS
MEIRQIPADERADTMFPLQAYAFTPSPWPADDEASYRRRMEFYRNVTSLVAEAGGQPLACVGALPMQQNVRGVVHDMAGIASVASHPSARRRGLVRQLMTRLLQMMRDQGCAVSTLYPFRPSFYGRMGYVGLPRSRRVAFPPESVSHLLRIDLPGTVERLTAAEAHDEYDAFTRRLVTLRHGFSVFDPVRNAEFRDDRLWVAVARAGAEVVGVLRYRIDRYGGDLTGSDLLSTGPLGRALLLQYLARHVDQVGRIVVSVDTGEVPELWGTDMNVTTEATVAYPTATAPMARVLRVEALEGTPVGEAGVTVEVADGPLITGVYRLESEAGRLRVGLGGRPQARMTSAGFSGLVYGVLDPEDVLPRGFGEVDADAIEPLRTLFPRTMPYVFSDF